MNAKKAPGKGASCSLVFRDDYLVTTSFLVVKLLPA